MRGGEAKSGRKGETVPTPHILSLKNVSCFRKGKGHKGIKLAIASKGYENSEKVRKAIARQEVKKSRAQLWFLPVNGCSG